MKKNTLKIVSITLVALLLVTGCKKISKLENGKDAVVSFKDSKISVDDLYNEMKDKYALQVLIDLIDKEVLTEEYKDNKTIDENVDKQVDYMITTYGNGDEKALLEITKSQLGISTMEELKAEIKLSYLREEAIYDYAKSLVSKDDVQKYYDEKIFGDISAKHILITPDVDSNATDAEKTKAEEAALKKAKEVITKLNKGEDWDKLAKEYSSDSSNKDKGGLLGDFVHGDMAEEFENAAKELEEGKYTTTPVKTTYGYHIIYKVSQKEKPELSVVEDDIIEELANDKLNSDATLQITALEEIRKKYGMDIEDSELSTQYKNYIQNYKDQLSN